MSDILTTNKCLLTKRIIAFLVRCDSLQWTQDKSTGNNNESQGNLAPLYFQKALPNLEMGDIFVSQVSNNGIKMSEKSQVIKVQSQRNCPPNSKQPLNPYWFWVMQLFQTSVHCPSNCSLFFILPLPSQAAFIMASPTYAPLLVYLNAISKHPPLHFPCTLLPFHFVCGHHHFPAISCVPGLPVSQVCRNESWGSEGALCHWSATCYALNTNTLVFDGCLLDANSSLSHLLLPLI